MGNKLECERCTRPDDCCMELAAPRNADRSDAVRPLGGIEPIRIHRTLSAEHVEEPTKVWPEQRIDGSDSFDGHTICPPPDPNNDDPPPEPSLEVLHPQTADELKPEPKEAPDFERPADAVFVEDQNLVSASLDAKQDRDPSPEAKPVASDAGGNDLNPLDGRWHRQNDGSYMGTILDMEMNWRPDFQAHKVTLRQKPGGDSYIMALGGEMHTATLEMGETDLVLRWDDGEVWQRH
mmetsp:Transcript_109213/g.308005  ORF Transcript_109213/g.308005 Transcript_109213/m.308005 type:complete len:236 (-) Transcript_109213:133-840(-)